MNQRCDTEKVKVRKIRNGKDADKGEVVGEMVKSKR